MGPVREALVARSVTKSEEANLQPRQAGPPMNVLPKKPVASRDRNTHHNTLVALGSAAVLAVYSAGFMRTKTAAARVASEERMGRHSSANDELGSMLADAARPTALANPVKTKPARKEPKPLAAPSRIAAAVKPTQTVSTISVPATTQAPAPEPVQTVQPPTPVEAPPKPAVEAAKWHDGVYSGWGTSRHGDIEATIEIKGGKIVSAEISQCRTRYPCSRIDRLPPQVVARQSAEVDYVSGATQSSDAFYDGVVEALKKAQ
jgi:uncharacterized protein with FMN-binding domain